jgi:flagellar L-ring protein precursor FlgH
MSNRIVFVSVVGTLVFGCASSDYTIQASPPVVRPKPVLATPASQGSLFPSALGSGAPRPLFEDRRARAVGDLLQVVVQENTAAKRASGNQSSRASALNGPTFTAESDLKFEGKGASSANNNFSGILMVMVTQVLSNGNLVVSGEKQVVIGREEEVIRFSGIVNPADLSSNSVLSTQVADARLEYRGRGSSDDATSPGWLSRGIFKIWPF